MLKMTKCQSSQPEYEFHISGEIRKKYKFDDKIFSIQGNVIFANFSAVRNFVYKFNLTKNTNENILPGQVNALGLLDEIFHYVLRNYEDSKNPGVFSRLYKYLNSSVGDKQLYGLLFEFVEKFPPSEIYKGKITTLDYLQNFTGAKPNYEIALEELILLYLDNLNPAGKKLKELFDENRLTNKLNYKIIIGQVETFFQNELPIANSGMDVISFLKIPLFKHPNSLIDQLEFIRANWGLLLDAEFMKKIMHSKDLSKEDIFLGQFGGDAPTIVPQFKGVSKDAYKFALGKSGYKYAEESADDYDEPERFTKDIDWMPNVVLLAKNIYVWLDQLSKKYQRNISRLDLIPEEEIESLSKHGFNGLWLIGIWERSSASKRIKHILGNIDAVASAYSLFDYHIAADIGGDLAYENLHKRCNEKGIRLASDMVPNHTGIYSQWIIDHPDYFIQRKDSPFPNYKFTGEDLSEDPNIEIKIEDGYWNRSDAAVVFRRIDKRNNDIRYIYHGNDGTVMPWNDTAQLDMLKREVRDAVIEKIFDVARKFSIIRFDAAMTLAKRHFSRLWYPEPGKGGDIAARTDYSMTKKEFDSFFPVEFWREVVDRINNELPDTLLLAEAFWMMEGYFVRTLGMHRVYNSAFMHMLMKEENEKYRDLITNTLEFEPEILKRYVNFMSNPDEETAIHQFGTDDKYFGVLTLMITLPGLPMFAHGQIEGFTEKYGMEYKRAYYNEEPKGWLIERHERETFPLLKKRYLFSEVENFWIYDFNEGNYINENVFAYSNTAFGERSLVFYNNRFERASGTITVSSPKLYGSNKELRKVNLAHALNLNTDFNYYYIFKDNHSGMEYIRSGFDIFKSGFYVELNGFEARVFIDFKEVLDKDRIYSRISKRLNGNGVKSVERAIREMQFEPIHSTFENLLKPDTVKELARLITHSKNVEFTNQIKYFCNDYESVLSEIKMNYNLTSGTNKISSKIEDAILTSRLINTFIVEGQLPLRIETNLLKTFRLSHYGNYRENVLFYLLYLTVAGVEELFETDNEKVSENIIATLLLDIPFKNILQRLGRSENELYDEISFLNTLIIFSGKLFDFNPLDTDKNYNVTELLNIASETLLKLLDNEFARAYMNANYHKGVWYINQERFEDLLDWIFTINIIQLIKDEVDKLEIPTSVKNENNFNNDEKIKRAIRKLKTDENEFTSLLLIIANRMELVRELKSMAKEAGFNLDKFKFLLKK